MNRKKFLKASLILSANPFLSKVNDIVKNNNSNTIRLLRHATLVIQLGNIKFLVDPMLSAKDTMDPIQNAENNTRIPMTDLPITSNELTSIINEVDAIIVTHTHRDHWDVAAQNLINKNKTIFCQPTDAEKIRNQGFTEVIPIEKEIIWNDISINRTNGKHGTGELEKKMGPVSGFALISKKESVYIAGDTVWCDDVKEALSIYKPTVTIVNCGAPQYITGGGPITMDANDVISVYRELSSSKLIAVHMDTINHCRVSRSDLKKTLNQNNLLSKIFIPMDGETIHL